MYYIRGTIKICVNEKKPKLQIRISPCTGFLTPDESPMVIAFPVDENNKAKEGTAKLHVLKEKELECEAVAIKDYLPALIAIAAQQKPVELRLDFDKSTTPKIVGFVFPTK